MAKSKDAATSSVNPPPSQTPINSDDLASGAKKDAEISSGAQLFGSKILDGDTIPRHPARSKRGRHDRSATAKPYELELASSSSDSDTPPATSDNSDSDMEVMPPPTKK